VSLSAESPFSAVKQPLWTVDDLAVALRITPSGVYRRRSLGQPLPPAIVIGRLLRWTPEAVWAWIDDHGEDSPTPPPR